jgi:hypothetical protein
MHFVKCERSKHRAGGTVMYKIGDPLRGGAERVPRFKRWAQARREKLAFFEHDKR